MFSSRTGRRGSPASGRQASKRALRQQPRDRLVAHRNASRRAAPKYRRSPPRNGDVSQIPACFTQSPSEGHLVMPDMPTTAFPAMLPDAIQTPPHGIQTQPPVTTPADLDRALHAWQSRFTGGQSPSAVRLALLDWAAHAANAPSQTAALARAALTQWLRLAQTAMGAATADRAAARRPSLHASGMAAAPLRPARPGGAAR